MNRPDKKEGNLAPSPRKKNPNNTVLDMMRRTANDNTPPILFWFYKVLILSLIVFGVIQLVSIFWKF